MESFYFQNILQRRRCYVNGKLASEIFQQNDDCESQALVEYHKSGKIKYEGQGMEGRRHGKGTEFFETERKRC